jgi:hypothetical protein
MSEVKISPMERRTLAALDSSNPFSTPVRPPQTLDGRPLPKREPEMPDVGDPVPEIKEAPEPVVEKKRLKRRAALETAEPAPASPEPEQEKEWVNPITQTHNSDGMPSYRCEFAGRDIFVGLSWYKTSNPVTTMALVAMALDFGKDQIRFDLVMGDSMIYHSRNKIAHKFLQTDAKWLFLLDDDMIPSIGRAAWYRSWVPDARGASDQALSRGVLHRLIGAGKTLVGAAYFGRQEGGRLACSDQSLAADARAYADKVVPVDWIGTGCLLVHRKVFESIREKYPELVSSDPEMPFDYFLPLGNGNGEDVSFCKRAKAAGHQTYIDLGIPVKHVGYKTY